MDKRKYRSPALIPQHKPSAQTKYLFRLDLSLKFMFVLLISRAGDIIYHIFFGNHVGFLVQHKTLNDSPLQNPAHKWIGYAAQHFPQCVQVNHIGIRLKQIGIIYQRPK